MIDTIYIAMSGLTGYERGLRVISNNAANLNTPGFKASVLQYADLYYGQGAGGSQYGFGLDTLGTNLNFGQGMLQNTGNGLDLAIDGDGLFVLRDGSGRIHYTRDGQFKFDAQGRLVSATTGEEVMALGADGALAPVTIASLRTSAAHATSRVQFSGNVSTAMTTVNIANVTVMDSSGSSHVLSARLDAVSGTPGAWDVTLLDGTTSVGTGRISFLGGTIDPAHGAVSVTYTPAGQSAQAVVLDFSSNTSSYNAGSYSTIAVASQDGFAPGQLGNASFDATGTLVLTYSNGQVVNGARLALGRFRSEDQVSAAGGNEFEARGGVPWQLGHAGDAGFGRIGAGKVEMSNVDLSHEFSNIVIMQRGYQASSQVMSTASEMLNQLFTAAGK